MKIAVLSVGLAVCAALPLQAQTKKVSYVGPDQGAWSEASNWNPSQVPANTGANDFAVRIALDVVVQLDIDPTVEKLTLGAESAQITATDHSLTVTGKTRMGPKNRLDVIASALPAVRMNLGRLHNFANGELQSGGYFVTAATGTTATLSFQGADIVTNSARLGLIGVGASIVDENGVDALRDLAVNNSLVQLDRQERTTSGDFTNNSTDGYGLYLTGGTHFTVAGNFVNNSLTVLTPFDNAQDLTAPVLLDVGGDATFGASSEACFEIYSPAIGATTHVHGAANLGGKLTLRFAADDTLVSNADTLTLLKTDGGLRGAFDNVASGARLNVAIGGSDQPVGSFRVLYEDGKITVSDYQALPSVTVSADGQVFVLTRAGDLSAPLEVEYAVRGSAQAGVDYATLSGTLKIKAGKATAKIPVSAFAAGVGKTVAIKVKGGDTYYPGANRKAALTLAAP